MKQPFVSGMCAFRPNHPACKGEFTNGDLVTPRTTLCSCQCHGSYDDRMVAAGYRTTEEEL